MHPLPVRTPSQRPGTAGFTLIELMAVTVMISVLCAIVVPKLEDMLEHVKVTRAIADISAIQIDIMVFEVANDSLPDDLNAIGRGQVLDPWGRAYVYLPYDFTKVKKNGYPPGARKDKLYKPLNSTFDLYSVGKDGQSTPNLDAKVSQDDVVRALDGMVALASYY